MKHRALLAGALGAFALSVSGTAQAAQDQAQEDTSGAMYSVTFGAVDGCGGVIQSFTAGLSGNLDQVDLFVGGGTDAPLVVEIRETSGGAATSTVLAGESIAPASVPSTPAFISIPLDPPAPVVATTQYAIVAYACVAMGVLENYAWGTGPSEASYTGGSACGLVNPGTTPNVTCAFSLGRDIAFRTHVILSTAVTFRSLSATRSGKGVLVRWRTASEAGTLGYHVYREVNGKRVRANARLIPPSGRGLYSFRDSRAARRYWIQEVAVDGTRTWHGPARVR